MYLLNYNDLVNNSNLKLIVSRYLYYKLSGRQDKLENDMTRLSGNYNDNV